MAITHVASVGAGGSATTVTTGTVDTSGADCLIAVVSRYEDEVGGTLTDSKSNTWTPVSLLPEFTVRCSIWYSAGSPTVGSGHTFTYAGTDVYASVAVMAFAGVHATPLDQEEAEAVGAVTTIGTGSITPTEDNELVVSGLACIDDGTYAVDESMTIAYQTPYDSGQHFGLAAAYKIQTTAAAIAPDWSWTDTVDAAACVASFKAAAEGGGGGGAGSIFGSGVFGGGVVR